VTSNSRNHLVDRAQFTGSNSSGKIAGGVVVRVFFQRPIKTSRT